MPRYFRVLVFGVFDRLHAGHRAFLRQARRHGRELIVAVARDKTVFSLKGHKPIQNEHARLLKLQSTFGVTKVVLGDRMLGSYHLVRRWKPDVICFGYDQKFLERDLKKQMGRGALAPIRLIRLRPYKPRRLHTSILQKKWYAKK